MCFKNQVRGVNGTFKETFSGISDEGLYDTESCSDEMGWTYANNNNTKIAPSFSPSYY